MKASSRKRESVKKPRSHDPDIVGALAALRRAARRARRLAIETGPPLIVMRRGKIVDANAARSASKGRRLNKKPA
jgi:hypothetical protein